MLKINKKNLFCLDTYVVRDKNCIGHCCSNSSNLIEKINIAIEAGYDCVELWHKDVFGLIENNKINEVNKIIKDSKIFVASYKVIEDWFEENPDNSKINEVLEAASKIESKSVVVKLLSDNKKHTRKPIGYYIDKYNNLLEKCQKFKIKPSIEFMCLANYMNSIDDVYNILDKTNGNLVLDTWHLWRNDGKDFDKFEISIKRLNSKWISVIHFTDASSKIERTNQKDGDRKLPGLGCLNLNKFCSLMNQINFTGTYSLNVYDQSLWNENPLSVASKGLHMMKSCLIQKSLLDSDSWKKDQKKRCEGLWNKQYFTHLDPRIEKSDRDLKLEGLLSQIISGKIVLDFKCGFSPLAKYISYGFDGFEGCIKYLKSNYPNSEWFCCSDEEFAKKFNNKIDVLLHIGLGDSLTEVESHFLVRQKCKPTTIILECAANSDGQVDESKKGSLERWNLLIKDLKNIKTFFYETNMKERNFRLLLVGEV
jgi:2-keto-myo-inositol isomerase